jgi:hypothetical protein
MNNGIALGLALICLLLIICLFKWCLNQFMFFQAILAGMNKDSDNQWKAIHRLELSRCPITGAIHLMNPNPMDAKNAKTDSPPQGS